MLLSPPVPRGVVDDASQLGCAPELSSAKERHLAQGYAPSPGTVLIQSLLHVGDRLNLGYRGRAIPAPELPMEPLRPLLPLHFGSTFSLPSLSAFTTYRFCFYKDSPITSA